VIDEAMAAIERENPGLKGVLPKDYSRPTLDKTRLGELVKLVGDIDLKARESGVKDPLGRVYEYFLGRFAAAEGKGGGEFYTPQCVVQLLVEMIEPYKGRVYDPCCGSGGMFVQSEKFVEEHGGKLGDIAIYGQESNPTTWRLAKMNLAIRRIDADLGPHHADTFHNDLHKDLKADYILANPPFNMSDWGGERLTDDPRWKYGVPPVNNANYAWIQHFIYHLAPNGIAGFVMANGSLSTSTKAELAIRKGIIEDDLVDSIVALPGQLFYTTQIPVSLWFVTRTPGAWGIWLTACTANSRAKKSGRSLVYTTLGRRVRATRTSPAGGNLRVWKKSASMATCSPRAATSAPKSRKTTACPSRRRWQS